MRMADNEIQIKTLITPGLLKIQLPKKMFNFPKRMDWQYHKSIQFWTHYENLLPPSQKCLGYRFNPIESNDEISIV